MTSLRATAGLYVALWVAVVSIVPESALAQQAAPKVPRVGVVFNSLSPAHLKEAAQGSLDKPGDRAWEKNPALAFRKGMLELGWVSGKNIEFLWRSADGDYSRRPQILRELVRMPVDVLAVAGVPMVREAQAITSTVPIVTLGGANPVDWGLAKSGRPGGNVTGVASNLYGAAGVGKRLEVLRQLIPGMSRVAFFVESSNEGRDDYFEEHILPIAKKLRVTLMRYNVKRIEEVDVGMADAKSKDAQAAYFIDAFLFNRGENTSQLVSYARKHRMPALFYQPHFAEAGGLAAYGIDSHVAVRRAAHFVDRILKGARPGDLPIEDPSKLELVINLSAAKAIGLEIPQSALLQADRVIE